MGEVLGKCAKAAKAAQEEKMEQCVAKEMAKNTVKDRLKGALYGLLIADAMAAPTHWFYGGPRQVASLYGGPIVGYTKPVERLPGSIMSKSNTGGAGRGGFSGDIIGKIIFHGKKKFWAPGEDFHYHHNLAAGDNTLEGLLTRRVMDVVQQKHGEFDTYAILDDYITFMTTPDTHNDTYCGTSHRMFFANYASGKPSSQCPDNDNHNVDSIDALVTTVPVSFLAAEELSAVNDTQAMLGLTRDSKEAKRFVKLFTPMIRQIVLEGISIRESVVQTGKKINLDVVKAMSSHQKSDPMTACYLDSAFPAALVMAYKYAPLGASSTDLGESFRIAVLANANRGGENVGSGALLGALWGAEIGFSNIPKDLVHGLAPGKQDQVAKEVDSFIASISWLQQTN